MEIYRFGSEWQVHTERDGAYAGSFNYIMAFCMKRLGVKSEELEMAVAEMIRKDHNAAHFGIFKGFIYTFNKERKYGTKAS